MMRVLGIDLAAQPKTTGLVLLSRKTKAADNQGWVAELPPSPATDELLIDLGSQVDVIGVDAPLGWPEPFVQAVMAHQSFNPWPGTENRRPLTHRLTDDRVRDQGWGQPMSASADRLGSVAMRCALLQREWANRWGAAAERDGSGRLLEVYPAAALRVWGISQPGYKGGTKDAADPARKARNKIFTALRTATEPWLDLVSVRESCVDSDHTLDALISAVIALLAQWSATSRPESDEDLRLAKVEGWIHVPIGPLELIRPPEA
ncbi:MAG: DUF429 domain-containing protein [Actinobacteria bacterium]|uniref:Unannotated protein n=2 Tax=freshwater metagenome TaxID=449393 RepID=A0A6J6UC64_9ZZZZ|nr:DUF429 domain-containing protein [Actinomycetota bacterium]MSY79986.1 DUF429 domain-containing protein [Actinomycetota bacterium]